MSLLELIVALSILSLFSGLVFSNLGPWLHRTRASSAEAAFWRGAEPTQILLSELTAGAIDPQSRHISASEARFRLLAPRLSLAPLDARLGIVEESGVWKLTFNTPSNGDSVLLEAREPLRFATSSSDELTIELEHNGRWTPLMTASFAATAPLTCEFDPISRTCRQ
jgi:hypothetical protein